MHVYGHHFSTVIQKLLVLEHSQATSKVRDAIQVSVCKAELGKERDALMTRFFHFGSDADEHVTNELPMRKHSAVSAASMTVPIISAYCKPLPPLA